MYKISAVRHKGISYNSFPLYMRLHYMRLLKHQGRKVAVYLSDSIDYQTFRYRVFNMCEAMEDSEYWIGTFFLISELTILKDYLKYVDILILSRLDDGVILEVFLKDARQYGIPVLYDVDDLVVLPQYSEMVIQSVLYGIVHEEEQRYWKNYVEQKFQAAQRCDGIIATNDYLKNLLSDGLEKPGFCFHNFLNQDQEIVSDVYFEKKIQSLWKPPFIIGYFSGTNTHSNDFNMVAGELEQFLDIYIDSILKIVGYMELPVGLKRFEQIGRIERIPFMDYLMLQKEIAVCDVNIVPLLINPFTMCKSELKFFEAGIVGTVSCVSPTFSFRNIVENNKNGFLCKDGDWFTSLSQIYAQRFMDGYITRVRESVCENYISAHQLEGLEKMLNLICETFGKK